MNKFKLLSAVIIVFCFLSPLILQAQVDTAWVRRYNGPGNNVDIPLWLTTDNLENVYVTGVSIGSTTGPDYATIKYFSNGDTAWVRRYNGPANLADTAEYIAVDTFGNVYVTGCSNGAGTNQDFLTIKYDNNGDTIWTRRYDGLENNTDRACAVKADNSGNVYVLGESYSLSNNYDFVTIKYDSNGNLLWARSYDGPGNYIDIASALANDDSGNVYVTGQSYGSGTGYDYATIKYNSNGDTIWVRTYNGPANAEERATSLAVDRQENVYVTGYTFGFGTNKDYATIKYNSNGIQQWVAVYNGPGNASDEASAIAVDYSGNIYVTGQSYSDTSDDYATIKYNFLGAMQWVQRYNGTGNSDDDANAIAIDGQSNIFVTGASIGSGTYYDFATVKYDSTGFQQWVQRYNGPGNSDDDANAVAVDDSGNVYITGQSAGAGSNFDYTTIKYFHHHGDVGCSSIIEPIGEIDSTAKIATRTLIVNNTGYTETFHVTLMINGPIWSSTKEITLMGMNQVVVQFDSWSVGSQGTYTVKCSTQLTDDANPANNVCNGSFTVALPGWMQKSYLPTTIETKYVKGGGALGGAGDVIYAFRGNNSNEFYKYVINDNNWLRMESIPYGHKPNDPTRINKKRVGPGSAIFNRGSYVFATRGSGTKEFWVYEPAHNNWIGSPYFFPFVPVNKGLKGGTSITNYFFLLAGGQRANTSNFFVFGGGPDTTRWDTLTDAPFEPDGKAYKEGSCIVACGENIYALKGCGKKNYFWSYNISEHAWTMKESIPLIHPMMNDKKTRVKDGGAMATDGNVIYAIKGGGSNEFWKYLPGQDTWIPLETIPRLSQNKRSVPKAGAALAYAHGAVFLLKGNSTGEFWRYFPKQVKGEERKAATDNTVHTLINRPLTPVPSIAVNPNPFTRQTTVQYTVPVSGKVSIKLYNSVGKIVNVLVDEYKGAGSYTSEIINSTLKISRGIYFLRFLDDTNQHEIKLIVE